jgi:hypothetical protein
VKVRIKAKTAAGQRNHLYDALLVDKPWPTSRIVSAQGLVYTREADLLSFSNNSGARYWPNLHGTFVVGQLIPLWSSADISGYTMSLLWLQHDSNNWVHIYYDGTNGRWVFERKVAGTVYQATKTHTMTAGTAFRLAFRWTSGEGELGLATFTQSVFVDGVKGTDVSSGAAPTEAASATAYYGKDPDRVDAFVKYRLLTPQVLSDTEIARAA